MEKKLTLYPYIRKETTGQKKLKNYGPISLLPICSKILEPLICNKMFTFFTENNLISPNESGFILDASMLTSYLLLPTKFINRLM